MGISCKGVAESYRCVKDLFKQTRQGYQRYQMSSWIRASGHLSKNASIKKEISSYHDTSSASGFAEIYLEYVMATIYYKKLNEQCNIWDPSGILRLSLKSTPLVKLLKEQPSLDPNSLELYKPTVSAMKISDIQKLISNVFEYTDQFNSLVHGVVDTLDLRRSKIDLSIYLTDSIPLDKYVKMVRNFQERFNMESLSIFLMGDVNLIKSFKALSNSSWKIIRITEEPKNDTETFIQVMAEVKMVSKSSSMILDFSNPIGRLIYLLHNYKDELQYFKEVNGLEWFLL